MSEYTEKSMTPLCKLARKHETDKGGWHKKYGGRDGDSCHNYTPTYYNLFRNREQYVRRVLEVGVDRGMSLRMWAENFPNAEVVGIDICPEFIFQEDRIQCYLADQASPSSLRDAILKAQSDLGPEKFDLIVDDGSHQLDHTIITAQALMPFVSSNGWYIIEDIRYDCTPESVADYIPIPAGFDRLYFSCGIGMGIARCDPQCPKCHGEEGETLIGYWRRNGKGNLDWYRFMEDYMGDY
jgi:cephalosporin hydroxylase